MVDLDGCSLFFVVLDGSMVVSDHPPPILVVFGVLGVSQFPFRYLVVVSGMLLADLVLLSGFQRFLVMEVACWR